MPEYSSPSLALPPQEDTVTPLMTFRRPSRVTVMTALPSFAVTVFAAPVSRHQPEGDRTREICIRAALSNQIVHQLHAVRTFPVHRIPIDALILHQLVPSGRSRFHRNL